MIGPMIFIGVGGSGGSTVRSIREFLWQKLIAEGWEGDFPECWQTLWIDTISVQGRGGFSGPLLPSDSYLGLVTGGVNYQNVAKGIENSLPAEHLVETLSGWMPQSSPVPIAKGAGQFRAIGRTIGVWQLAQIKNFISDAIERTKSSKGVSDLATLTQMFKLPVDGKVGTTSVFVISSMAGGSGSGLFQDVAHMVKVIDNKLDSFTHVLLYGADVFKLSVDPNMMQSIPGNTLGGVAETLNGVWRTNLTSATEALYSRAGFANVGIKRYGGKHHWLIGASNENSILGSSTDEIYRAVGSSLAALAVSPSTLDWLNDFVLTNVFAGSATNVTDETKLKNSTDPEHYQPYASMGFSRITLGMDYFTKYAAEAITKSAVKKMLWPDYEPVDINSVESPGQKVDSAAGHAWPDFIKASGLNERNPSNDVLDALKPKDDSIYTKFAADAIDNSAGREGTLEASNWEARISGFFKANARALVSNEQQEVYKAARIWTEEIQEKILNATAQAVGLYGIRVAVSLLKKLQDELEFLVRTELPTDAAKRTRWIDELSGNLMKLLNTGKTKIAKTDNEINKAREALKTASAVITEVERIKLAIDLLSDLDKNFISGLLASLENSSEALKSSLGSENLEYAEFPDLDQAGVPKRFAPPNTEQSLIDYETFRELLEEWSKGALNETIRGAWKNRLIDRAIRGVAFDESGDDKNQKLIGLEPRWVPMNSESRSNLGNATPAGFKIVSNVEDFYDQAFHMIKYQAGPLSDQVNMGLRDYVQNVANPSEQTKRAKAFEVALVAALRYCAPMVTENVNVLGIVHPNSASGHYISFSPIPFENTQLEDVIRKQILTVDKDNMAVNRRDTFTNSTSINKVEFYSVLKNARNPLVFDSLMRPIAEDWRMKSTSSAARQQFWTLRRTKPLLESIPAAEENINNMVTGWFALAFIGGRKYTPDSTFGPKVSIFNFEDKTWLDFPHPLLGLPEPTLDHDYLPSVLVSLNLALVHVNEKESINPLRAYQALMKAGSKDSDWGVAGLIKRYIAEGGPTPDSLSPDDRRAQLLKNLEMSTKYFEEIFDAVEATKSPYTAHKIYELKTPVRQAFTTLIAAANSKGDPAAAGVEVRG